MTNSSMITALNKSISYWQKHSSQQGIKICNEKLSGTDLLASLIGLKEIFKTKTGEEFDREIKNNFRICPADNGRDSLITGYYQPIFQGSLQKSPPYIYPLYRTPPDLVSSKKLPNGKESLDRRRQDGTFIPYWSREEIEKRNLLKGLELVYLKDPMEVFTLHIQGSGMIRLKDGSLRAILFAKSNGRPYRSIGRLLVREKRIPLAEISMAKITDYLHEHVDERQRILHYNERFIFFRWGPKSGSHGVFGSMGAELTPGRSAAMDRQFLPVGMAAYLISQQPVFDQKGQLSTWQPLRRFVLHQDSGAAIKGKGRLDLFWGAGDQAGWAAGLMKQPGKLYFLIKK